MGLILFLLYYIIGMAFHVSGYFDDALDPAPRENGIAGTLESLPGRNQSANRSREALHKRSQIAHPFLKSFAPCIDSTEENLIFEHEVAHDLLRHRSRSAPLLPGPR